MHKQFFLVFRQNIWKKDGVQKVLFVFTGVVHNCHYVGNLCNFATEILWCPIYILQPTYARTVRTIGSILYTYVECNSQYFILLILISIRYGFIFPLYVYYFFDIPRISATYFCGIPFTSKTITYLLGLQIASTSTATALSSICGIVSSTTQ